MTEQHKKQQYTPSYSTPTNKSIRVLLPTVEKKQKKSSLNDNNSSSSNNSIDSDKKQQSNKNINSRRRQRSNSHTDYSDNSSQGSSSTTSSKKESRSSSSSSSSSTKKAPPKKQKQPHHNSKQHPHSSKNGYNNNKHYNKKNNNNNKHWQGQYVAMDCEMVGIGTDGIESALARVTIVNYDGYIIYDQYVKPDQPVTDYRTFVSGITPEQLSNESGAIPYLQCRHQVQNIIKNKILIGHGLNNDLSVLNLYHPWEYIRDTALYEPFMKIRNYYYNPYYDNTNNNNDTNTLLCPRKLKDLSKDLLQWDIQCINEPHSPIEDAVAALQLYKLVKYQWEKLIQYKIHKSNNILQHKQQHNNVKVVNNNNKVQQQQQQQQQQSVETTAKAIASAA